MRLNETEQMQDAITLLDQDHEKVEELFERFESLDENSAEREEIIEMACMELTIHARLEEQIFYPALRKALGETELLDEAEVEHMTAKDLISQIRLMNSNDRLYAAKFMVLAEYVKHHVEEERNEIFPEAKRSGLDLEAMGQELAQRKEQLRQEMEELPDENMAMSEVVESVLAQAPPEDSADEMEVQADVAMEVQTSMEDDVRDAVKGRRSRASSSGSRKSSGAKKQQQRPKKSTRAKRSSSSSSPKRSSSSSPRKRSR